MVLRAERESAMQFVDETAKDLRKLVEQDFGPCVDGHLTNRQVLDWMHYRARLIPCRPRTVKLSPEILAQMASYPAIARLKIELEAGRDVSPWLSERVRRRKEDGLADLMFNDWQISHFHLSSVLGPRNKVKRTGQLLFAHVRTDRAVFLDVQPHGSWSMKRILKVLKDVSPGDLPAMIGIVPPRNGAQTDEQLLNLRQNGYSTSIELDGAVYAAPSLGISSSRHATRLSLRVMRLARQLEHLRGALDANSLPWPLQSQLANTIGLPIRLGLKLEAGCLVIYEKTRGIEFARFTTFE
jgi:hypothetical protein